MKPRLEKSLKTEAQSVFALPEAAGRLGYSPWSLVGLGPPVAVASIQTAGSLTSRGRLSFACSIGPTDLTAAFDLTE